MTTILVGTDTSASADLAVDDAARLARDRGAELVVLYVEKDGELRAVVDPAKAADPRGYLARMKERFPDVTTSARVESGDAADRIVAVAAELKAEAIVLGNRGVHGPWWRVKDSVRCQRLQVSTLKRRRLPMGLSFASAMRPSCRSGCASYRIGPERPACQGRYSRLSCCRGPGVLPQRIRISEPFTGPCGAAMPSTA